ncbi:MAG TPA: ABC transporter permease, partial [Fimbriimonadaceae bacterium]
MDWVMLLQFATPLALAALGETVGQKSGLLNIGLEGTMLIAAYFAATATLWSGSPWIGLLVGAFAGLVLTLIGGYFSISLGSDQVVVGMAINLFALGLTGGLFRKQFGQTGHLFSVQELPKWHGFDWVMLFALLGVLLVTWSLFHSAWGLALRSAGEYPKATEAAGLSVNRLRFQACAVAGFFGGLGGAYLSLGVVGSFAENMTGGRGFIAIAMVTFGRWKPSYVFLACLLIGY